ncbi:transposase [Streptomyces scopuliridis]|uniref:transposase n=1 Tax=Streptomyces scopuliridis TaxID=452529 RepID=UPI0036B2F0C9
MIVFPRLGGDLTVIQLALLEPLLLERGKAGRPSVHSKRQLINGIRFRTRTGIPWRDLPERTLRPAGDGVRAVPPLAAQRHLAPRP